MHLAHTAHQKKLSDAPDLATQQAWFRGMKKVLEEIDEFVKCIPETVPLKFLDLGCCPGGFSSYILDKNPKASGVGISLDVEKGGHSFQLEEHLQPRLELNFGDLTRYQLGPTTVQDPTLHYLPASLAASAFDLILLDGHPLRVDKSRTSSTSHRLLISQLIIALGSISLSGTLIIKLSTPERVDTAKILYLLDILSLHLTCWKPVFMHATQPTFYAIAKGVGYGEYGYMFPNFLMGLQELWMDLTFGGAMGKGRKMEDGDLDFIIGKDALENGYKERLHQLAHPIWTVQAQSWKGWLATDGIRSPLVQ
ncbi:hypothetical protein FIBSPDRAFT_911933 [Athelia psychrophila]|uniref:Ribosomal RNA methyltransferase FtsJ domain-containing protein n=1 Tax=Athelia psychrophila TaxID=1759441 RepID=A0A166G8J8_9AGAM|nr:hypothetical protein FIBSPDRAFT_911933 [Fibularhizoctonia sp. CBS 109695]